jgi:hypothetical protein
MTGEDHRQRTPRILHAFADHGVESEALAVYGAVTRATIDPVEYDHSEVVRVDLSDPDRVPFPEGQFDLAVLHPPCTAYSDMPEANKDGDAPRLIPEARDIGQRYADHYVVENKPEAPLRDPVVLDGRMFGLPIKYERGFETSFPVDQPPRNARLGQPAETSPFFYSERSPAWWRGAKGGIRGDYPKEHVAKNALPLPYVHHLVRAWMDAAGRSQGVADYSDYDEEMDVQRAREANETLGAFQ